MDRLRWDSEVFEAYLTNLLRMDRRLTEQIQQLDSARKSMIRQGVTAKDKTLYEVLNRLETAMKRLTKLSDRIRQLIRALTASMEMFRSAENKIRGMGMDMLYLGVSYGSLKVIPVTLYTNPFLNRFVTPDWLSRLAGTAAAENTMAEG